MTRKEMERALGLLEHLDKLANAVVELNDVNGDESKMTSIRPQIFGLVDQSLVAKGLLSLVSERQIEIRAELDGLGVNTEVRGKHG